MVEWFRRYWADAIRHMDRNCRRTDGQNDSNIYHPHPPLVFIGGGGGQGYKNLTDRHGQMDKVTAIFIHPPNLIMGKYTDLTLIRVTAMVLSFSVPFSWLHTPRTNWCGNTNTKMSASFAASFTSGTATCSTSRACITDWPVEGAVRGRADIWSLVGLALCFQTSIYPHSQQLYVPPALCPTVVSLSPYSHSWQLCVPTAPCSHSWQHYVPTADTVTALFPQLTAMFWRPKALCPHSCMSPQLKAPYSHSQNLCVPKDVYIPTDDNSVFPHFFFFFKSETELWKYRAVGSFFKRLSSKICTLCPVSSN